MAVDLVVPSIGESITEVQIGTWFKSPGDYVEKDEAVVDVESEKATVEIFAPISGKLSEVLKQAGDIAEVGDVIARMEEGEAPSGNGSDTAESATSAPEAQDKPVGAPPAELVVMPAARRLLGEHGLAAGDVEASGPGGRLLKEDVLRHLEKSTTKESTPPTPPAPSTSSGEEEIVPMSPMRRHIAEQLVKAQQNAALLTTFNEVDMSGVMELRNKYKETYTKKYGVKLGFMSFFVKACVEGLRSFPRVNAEVRGTDVVYRNHYDIGIAVGGGKGLVVPVLRNAERMSFAEIEIEIGDFGARAQKNKITLDEMKGGTFTISNGGVYGSMLSTPIINPPQSGILGMHNIVQRPVALNGEVVIRPIMYLALSYDHRIVDGREAVSFLVRVKECIEDPSRILLEI